MPVIYKLLSELYNEKALVKRGGKFNHALGFSQSKAVC